MGTSYTKPFLPDRANCAAQAWCFKQNQAFQDSLAPVALFGPLLGHFGWIWGVTGSLLGGFWALLASLWVPLGPQGDQFGSLLASCWASLGLSASLLVSFGVSWRPFGASGTPWGRPWGPRPHFRLILE